MNPRLYKPEMALLLRELEYGPATTDDIVAVLRIAKRNVNHYLKTAREHGLIHVGTRERYARPVWVIGPGRDVQYKPLTPAQRAKRRRSVRREKSA